jgi:hypothetical protein
VNVLKKVNVVREIKKEKTKERKIKIRKKINNNII